MITTPCTSAARIIHRLGQIWQCSRSAQETVAFTRGKAVCKTPPTPCRPPGEGGSADAPLSWTTGQHWWIGTSQTPLLHSIPTASTWWLRGESVLVDCGLVVVDSLPIHVWFISLIERLPLFAVVSQLLIAAGPPRGVPRAPIPGPAPLLSIVDLGSAPVVTPCGCKRCTCPSAGLSVGRSDRPPLEARDGPWGPFPLLPVGPAPPAPMDRDNGLGILRQISTSGSVGALPLALPQHCQQHSSAQSMGRR